MEENNTQDELSGADAVASGASDSESAVSSDNAGVLSIQEINNFLGKNFKDKDTALKALKDTQSYVGMKKEQIAEEVKASSASASNDPYASKDDVKKLTEELFYAQNPDYKPLREFIGKTGDNPAEVVETESFKKIFDNYQLAEQTKNSRTVLESNPRVGQVRNKLDEARASVYSDPKKSNQLAVDAVLDAYELK